MDFQSEKSFGKLRLMAFQPYHQILCILKHVEDVKDYLRHLQHALIYTVFESKTLPTNDFELTVPDLYIVFVPEDSLIVNPSSYLLPAILMYNWKVYNLPQLWIK